MSEAPKPATEKPAEQEQAPKEQGYRSEPYKTKKRSGLTKYSCTTPKCRYATFSKVMIDKHIASGEHDAYPLPKRR